MAQAAIAQIAANPASEVRVQTIRIPVDDIRIAGRNTQGVKLFHTEPDEHVVSAARFNDPANGDDDADDDDSGDSGREPSGDDDV